MNLMTRTSTRSLSTLISVVLAFTSIGHTWAQETQPAPSPNLQTALLAPPINASQPTTAEHGPADQPIAATAATAATADTNTKDALSPTAPQSAATSASVVTGKKAKQEYTGPTTLVELPPTPMLDAEGKQQQ